MVGVDWEEDDLCCWEAAMIVGLINPTLFHFHQGIYINIEKSTLIENIKAPYSYTKDQYFSRHL